MRDGRRVTEAGKLACDMVTESGQVGEWVTQVESSERQQLQGYILGASASLTSLTLLSQYRYPSLATTLNSFFFFMHLLRLLFWVSLGYNKQSTARLVKRERFGVGWRLLHELFKIRPYICQPTKLLSALRPTWPLLSAHSDWNFFYIYVLITCSNNTLYHLVIYEG